MPRWWHLAYRKCSVRVSGTQTICCGTGSTAVQRCKCHTHTMYCSRYPAAARYAVVHTVCSLWNATACCSLTQYLCGCNPASVTSPYHVSLLPAIAPPSLICPATLFPACLTQALALSHCSLQTSPRSGPRVLRALAYSPVSVPVALNQE